MSHLSKNVGTPEESARNADAGNTNPPHTTPHASPDNNNNNNNNESGTDNIMNNNNNNSDTTRHDNKPAALYEGMDDGDEEEEDLLGEPLTPHTAELTVAAAAERASSIAKEHQQQQEQQQQSSSSLYPQQQQPFRRHEAKEEERRLSPAKRQPKRFPQQQQQQQQQSEYEEYREEFASLPPVALVGLAGVPYGSLRTTPVGSLRNSFAGPPAGAAAAAAAAAAESRRRSSNNNNNFNYNNSRNSYGNGSDYNDNSEGNDEGGEGDQGWWGGVAAAAAAAVGAGGRPDSWGGSRNSSFSLRNGSFNSHNDGHATVGSFSVHSGNDGNRHGGGGFESHNFSANDGNNTALSRPPPAEEEQQQPKVNNRPAVIGYFGYLAGQAAVGAYWGLMLKDKGFTEKQIGWFVACFPAGNVLVVPFFTFLADRFRCARQILVCVSVAAAVLLTAFTLTTSTAVTIATFLGMVVCFNPMNPLLDQVTLLMFPPRGRTAAWGYVRAFGALGWGVGCPVSSITLQLAGSRWVTVVPQFILGQLALIYCVYTVKPWVPAATTTTATATTTTVLSRVEGGEEETIRRRHHRGTSATEITVVAASTSAAAGEEEQEGGTATGNPPRHAPLQGAGKEDEQARGRGSPNDIGRQKEEEEVAAVVEAAGGEDDRKVRVSDVLNVLRAHHRLVVFMAAATMMGMGYSFINNFLFIFLEELGAPKVLLGVTILLTVSTEVPIFQYSDAVRRALSDRQMISLAMAIWAARVVGYSLMRNPWVVLLIEPLHGVTFALMWLPSMHLVQSAFPAKLASSGQGVLTLCTAGVGPIMGNLLAGWLYEAVGPRSMFRIAAAAMATALAIYLCVDFALERRGYRLGGDDHTDEGHHHGHETGNGRRSGGGQRQEQEESGSS